MQQKFLDKYYPPAKAAQVRRALSTIRQGSMESMYEYLERFNTLEQSCFNLGLPEPVVIEYLLAGLLPLGRMLLDAAAGGSVMNLTPAQIRKLIAETAESARFREESERRDDSGRVRNVSQAEATNAQLAAEVKELKDLLKQQMRGQIHEDPAEVNAMGYQNYNNRPQAQGQFGLAANGYSWKNEGFNREQASTQPQQHYYRPPFNNQGYQNSQYQQRGYNQSQNQNPSSSKSLEDIVRDLATSMQQNQIKTDGAIAEMSKQISQLATTVSELKNDPGKLPSQTVQNPRGNVNAFMIIEEEREDVNIVGYMRKGDLPQGEEQNEDPSQVSEFHNSNYYPRMPLPFPMQDDKQNGLVSNETQPRGCEGKSAEAKRQETNQKALANRTRDPGAFTVTCGIGNVLVPHCLVDLGASVNIMPYTLYRSLKLGPLKPAKLSIELGNKSCVRPNGFLENLTISIGEIVVPADFYVMQMEETVTKEAPTLILGRPILFATKAKIDMAEGSMVFEYGGKEAEIRVFEDDHRPCAKKPPDILGKTCDNNLTDGFVCLIQGRKKHLKGTRTPRPPDKKRARKQKCGVVARKSWMPEEKNWRAKPPDGRQMVKSALARSGEEKTTLKGKFDLAQPWDPNL